MAYLIFAITISTALISAVTAYLAFGWKFISIDVGRSMFAFVFVADDFTAFYMALVGMFLLRHRIGTIFENLSIIYKDSKCLFFGMKLN